MLYIDPHKSNLHYAMTLYMDALTGYKYRGPEGIAATLLSIAIPPLVIGLGLYEANKP